MVDDKLVGIIVLIADISQLVLSANNYHLSDMLTAFYFTTCCKSLTPPSEDLDNNTALIKIIVTVEMSCMRWISDLAVTERQTTDHHTSKGKATVGQKSSSTSEQPCLARLISPKKMHHRVSSSMLASSFVFPHSSIQPY